MSKQRKVTPMKQRKALIALFLLLALALGGLLGARPLYNFYRDVSFSWKERTPTEKAVKAYAEQMGISYGEYPQYLIDLWEDNPETGNFVLNYPFREEKSVDLSAYEGSPNMPLFLQWDPQWGYKDYGSSCIAITGCGPTCLAMVGYHLTGDSNMTPDKIAKFAEKNGYYERGYGSSWTLISEGTAKLGLTATELPLVKKKMVDALEAGSPIILALGPGVFTSTGHYIVLTGYTDGSFTINDPNSQISSQRAWTYEELEPQIRNIWAISLP